MTLPDLPALLALLREARVSHFKLGDLELTLEVEPLPMPLEPRPRSRNTGVDDELLYYSS